MRVADEHGGDGRAQVVPHRRSTQGTDLADGVAPDRKTIHQADARPASEQVGGRLGRRSQGLSNLGGREGGPTFTGEPVKELQRPLICYRCLQFTLSVY
ncbi:MAG: hypothetical protein JWM55_2024 [Acidimicrobiaceae bacterium]|nr:hypothetical protein [Acidimicrobiaceae bacterium]